MICAVIATRYHPPEFAGLVTRLLADDVVPIVLESGEYDHRIYAMWNAGVRQARSDGATEIAVLNDDITILPGTLPALARALRSFQADVVYPDVRAPMADVVGTGIEYTQGSWGAGGMTGFCFMFKAELPLPAFDEAYHWWYGDDAWERDVRAAGYRVGRVVGVPIAHTPDGSARRDWSRLAPLIEQDRARFEGRAA